MKTLIPLVLALAPTVCCAQLPGIEARALVADRALDERMRSVGVRPLELAPISTPPGLTLPARERVIVTLPVFAAPPTPPDPAWRTPVGPRFDMPPSAGGGMPGAKR